MAAPKEVFKNETEGSKLVAATSQFALNLYKDQAAANTGNVFLSPYSIAAALAMTYLGARGETMKQMKHAMCMDDVSDQELHQAFSDIRNALKNTGDNYKLHVANRLFGQKTYNFLKEFLDNTEKFYGASLEPVDFVHAAPGAVKKVNAWVASNTNNKIPEIVPLAAVDALTRLIIVNAIYFKGDWMKKFNPDLTKDEFFHLSTTESVKVPLMYMAKAKVMYGVDQTMNCQAVELPYVGGSLSMLILLPDQTVTNLQEVEYKLTDDHLQNVEEKFTMRKHDVNIWLPKFKLDEKLDLEKVLARLGMVDLFQGSVADLSGMDNTKGLYVSKVLHRAFIEVNEEGSEAAAATAVVMKARSAVMVKDPFEFKADHPFIFFIRDNSTKSVLFLGRFQKP